MAHSGPRAQTTEVPARQAGPTVFVHEYFSSGAYAGELRASALAPEGLAMLAALLEDFAACGVGRVVTTLDRRLMADAHERRLATWADINWADSPVHERGLFQALAAQCETAFVIAPETDGILLARRRQVETAGSRFLGHSADAIRLCSDKLAFFEHLTRHDLPTIPTQLFDRQAAASTFPFPVVIKPRDGAGSQDTFLIASERDFAAFSRDRALPLAGQPLAPAKQSFAEGHSQAELGDVRELDTTNQRIPKERRTTSPGVDPRGSLCAVDAWALQRVPSRECPGGLTPRLGKSIPGHPQAELGNEGDVGRGQAIIQPFIAGQSLSVAAIVDEPSQVVHVFPAGRQHLSDDGRFHYQGGTIPARLPETVDPAELVTRACRSIRGLSGYIGFDLLLTDARQLLIVEANPRLTTAYLGYRALAKENLAARMLHPATTHPIDWRSESVEFTPDGRLRTAGETARPA
jgi:predicted ATP-grasp superfamily ATP-dependent carboligase